MTKVTEALLVEVPAESLFNKKIEILATGENEKIALRPSIRKTRFALPAPTREDPLPDLARLRRAIGDVTVSYEMLRIIPGFLRANDWKGTAVVSNEHLIALEKGDTSDILYGVACDVGTTTIVSSLVDLTTGEEVANASCINPQTSYGDDVLSRIAHIREQPHTLTDLQSSVITALNGLINQLTGKIPRAHGRIYEMAVAGNTTMQQILCGYDPSALGELPFVPAFDTCQRVHASHVGLKIHPEADLCVYGQIGGFIGGDTLACMVSARLDTWDKPVLLVDIGTNGEIVLAYDGKIHATSTAAGPAFEGGRITQGMRGTTGAIEKVIIEDDVEYNVIGNTVPIGICGSGLIDAAAQLRRKGIIDMIGKMCGRDEVPDDTDPRLIERIIDEENEQKGFVLVPAQDSGRDSAIVLHQGDIREFQLASGAIRAGISILLKRAGVSVEELDTVLLAGAFGTFIRRSSALGTGILPPIDPGKIRSIGNAALSGARLALLSLDERDYSEKLRANTTFIDLSMDQEFNTEFGMAMMFPE
jgi:uncharacterized 2Fe-2S/4Fe-4S cluster protein (DUF4445 family)